jgi:hypothetical protein
MAHDWAHPMTPLWTQVRAWFLETLLRLSRFDTSRPPTYPHSAQLRLPCPRGWLSCWCTCDGLWFEVSYRPPWRWPPHS